MEVSKRDSLSSKGSTDEKRRRTRRRKLHAGICSQVEFYFSDANLRKDRFLNQEITKSVDGFVPLDMVASFNKIRALTEDVGMIAKALQKSKLVEFSPDGTALKRVKPLEEPKYDPDDCTVYVECLPKTADIDWIQKAFKYCGKVVYVSIPRYQSTGDIKGFAFVEYETPEEAQRACQLLNNPLDDYGPPGMFPKTIKGKFIPIDSSQISLSHGGDKETEEEFDDNGRRHHKHRTERGEEEEARDEKEEETDHHSRKHLKRRHHHDVKDGQDSKKTKKLQDKNMNEGGIHGDRKAGNLKHEKGMTENEENRGKKKRKNEIVEDEDKDGKKRKKEDGDKDDIKGKEETDESREDIQGKEDEEKREEDKKKSRKRKTKDDVTDDGQKKKKHREDGETEVFVKVKQKDEENEVLKKTKKKENRKKKRFRQKKEKEEEQLFLRVMSKAEWLKLKEQYLHLQKLGLQETKNAMRAQWRGMSQAKPVVTQEAPKTVKSPEFTQGVILRIQATEPIESRKELREKLDAAAPVAYIDLEDGDTGGFVRFKFQQAAEKVLSQEIDGLETISFTLLTGDEENKYWQKVNADWENKLSSNSKRKKKRGRTRVRERAERALSSKMSSHISFNDEDV